MSYTPRTKLSCDSSACTVLNDGYVFVTSGLGANQRMPLADWRIIIGGEALREEFIPLAGAIHSGSAASAEFIPLAGVIHSPLGQAPTLWSAPEPLGTPAPEPAPDAPPTAAAIAVAAAAAAPVGTKWRWATDEHNYCVAIQTKYGVLQVKKRSWSPGTLYDLDLERKNFATYEAWVVSLPDGGTITKTLAQDILSERERRKKQSIALLSEGGGTASAIEKLMKMWKVRTWVNRNQSLNQRISYAEDQIASLRGQLGRVTLEQDIAIPKLRRSTTRRLEKFVKMLAGLKARAAQQSPEQNAYRETYLYDSYKQRLFLHTGEGSKFQIAYDKETQSVAVRVPVGISSWMHRILLVQRLEDVPFSLGAYLHLSVRSQGREIDLLA